MDMPLISIIIPIYNVEKYLSRCIESVISQSYTNLEIILVDDGSPDCCPKICDEYAEKDSRIKVIHKENGGAASARNAGLNAAAGKYIGFVDSDDYIHPDMYKTLYEKISEYDADVAECMHKKIIFQKYQKISPAPLKHIKTEVYSGLEFMKDRILRDYLNTLVVWNKLYKAEIWNSVRFPEGNQVEDIHVAFESCYMVDKVAVVDAKLYYYLMRTDSTTNNNNIKADDSIAGYDHMLECCRSFVPYPKCEEYSDLIIMCRQTIVVDGYFAAYTNKNRAAMKKYYDIYKSNKEILKKHKFHAFASKCFLFDIHPKVLILGYKIRNIIYRV